MLRALAHLGKLPLRLLKLQVFLLQVTVCILELSLGLLKLKPHGLHSMAELVQFCVLIRQWTVLA